MWPGARFRVQVCTPYEAVSVNSAKLYLRYVTLSIRGQMQYRASFVMLTLGHFAITAVEFLAIWVLFERFGALRGWSLAEVALFYGIVNIAFALSEAFARGFDTFPGMVKIGEFDRVLLRPRSTVLQLLGRELQLLRVGRIAEEHPEIAELRLEPLLVSERGTRSCDVRVRIAPQPLRPEHLTRRLR